MNWKALFSSRILSRGREYYLDGSIIKYEETQDCIQAEVAGTQLYKVKISLSDNEVNQMECECPYAQDGKACKHMAAVLYGHSEELKSPAESERMHDSKTFDDKDLYIFTGTTESYERKKAAVTKMVMKSDEETVRNYLVSVLMESDNYLLRFKKITDVCSQGNVQQYIERIQSVADCYMGRKGFIDYYAADEFVSELCDFLETDARIMVDQQLYLEAFQLANAILSTLDSVDMDDSTGGAGMLADDISKFWIELLSQIDDSGKREMFQWFMEQLRKSDEVYSTDLIEEIFIKEFREDEYLVLKMEFAQERITALEKSEIPWQQNYRAGKWIKHYLKMLQEHGAEASECKAFCREHWQNTAARMYYIGLCEEEGAYEEALQSLDESIAMDRSLSKLQIRDYEKQKKDIYRVIKDEEHYREQLWKLVEDYSPVDIELYRELRGLYDGKSWSELRERIISSIRDFQSRNELLKEEKLYDRLLDSVLQSPGLYTLRQYDDVLGELYPVQILEKYRQQLNQMAEMSSDRKKYRELAGWLKRLQKFDGGDQVVLEILDDWKIRYKRRPAMMQELNAIKKRN